MNANNYTDWNLIKFSILLSFLTLLNYFFWSINSLQIIKFINLFILFSALAYFFISKRFKHNWHFKIIILVLLLICLGTPAIPNDTRNLFLFPAKLLFYESNLYVRLNTNNDSVNYFLDVIYAKPKFAATLSATFAQLVGHWNEVFPKSTNLIIIFPPLIFLISFFKEKSLVCLWLFLMLFFSGKLFINGLMDGIISIYFVACMLAVYKISLTKVQSEKRLLYISIFIFFSILSLCKHEGGIMVLTILISSFTIDVIFSKKINYKLLFISFFSLMPLFFWKYIFIKNNIKMEFLQYGNPVNRLLERILNTEDLHNIIHFLSMNNKLLIAIFIFTFISFIYFKKNRKLIFYILLNFILYFSLLIVAILITPHTVLTQLEQSSIRIFIPLVLMLIYFSIYLVKDDYFLRLKEVFKLIAKKTYI